MDPASDAAKLSEHSKASLVAGVCETHALQYWYGDIQSHREENLSRKDGKGRTPYPNTAEVVLSMDPASKQTQTSQKRGSFFRLVLESWLAVGCSSRTQGHIGNIAFARHVNSSTRKKEATYPRQRTVILRRVLDWAAMALMSLQNIDYTCQANSLWSRKNVEFGWTRGSHGFTALSNPEKPDLQQQKTDSQESVLVVAHNSYC